MGFAKFEKAVKNINHKLTTEQLSISVLLVQIVINVQYDSKVSHRRDVCTGNIKKCFFYIIFNHVYVILYYKIPHTYH
jgi:hypothetical protein